jgi:hypothetical protein
MTAAGGDLSVRSHERVKCALPAEVWVGERSAGRVRLAGAARNAEGATGVTVVDCSLGGLGLASPVFFPRAGGLRVRSVGRGGRGGTPEVFEATVAVQRVAMTDRVPTYYVGGAFEGAAEGIARRLMDIVRAGARDAEAPRA